MLKLAKSFFSFKSISVLISIVLILNLALAGCIFPKKQAMAMVGVPDIIGGIANVFKYIWKVGVEYAQAAWESAGTWATALLGQRKEVQTWMEKAIRIAAYILMHQILSMITNDIINWINGGGKPRFVSDWKKMFTDAIDNAAGAFFTELTGIDLCSPFKLDIQWALLPKIGIPEVKLFAEEAACKFSDMDNFFSDFRNGGWENWAKITQSENNFFGVYFSGKETRMTMEQRAKEAMDKEGLAGKGFLSQKCTKEMADAKKCKLGAIITPGDAISHSTNLMLNKDFTNLQFSIADLTDSLGEFAPYVIAIGNALIGKVMKEGLALVAGEGDIQYQIIKPPDPSTFVMVSEDLTYGPALLEQLEALKKSINATLITSLQKKMGILNDINTLELSIIDTILDLIASKCSVSGVSYSLVADSSKQSTTIVNGDTTTKIEPMILTVNGVGTAEVVKKTVTIMNGIVTVSTTITYALASGTTPETAIASEIEDTETALYETNEISLEVDDAIPAVETYLDYIETNETALQANPPDAAILAEAKEQKDTAVGETQEVTETSSINLQPLTQDVMNMNTDVSQQAISIEMEILGTDGTNGVLSQEKTAKENLLGSLENKLFNCLNPSSD